MKRLSIIFLLLFTLASLWAGVAKIDIDQQVGNRYAIAATGVDTLIMTTDPNNLWIKCKNNPDECKWYNITNLNTPVSNGKTFSPDDETYRLITKTGTVYDTLTFAVINYTKYPVTALYIDPEQTNECNSLGMVVESPLIHYNIISYGSIQQQLFNRKLEIEYTTLVWDDTDKKWKDSLTCKPVTPSSPVTRESLVPAPLKNTTFCLRDTYSDSLMLHYDSLCTTEYKAIAVDCHLTSTTVARQDGNEMDRPTAETIRGSGPLEILFKSNPTPGVKYYEWRINSGKTRLATRQDENTRYTFQEVGVGYSVALTVRGDSICDKTADDSIRITINNSMLKVPNVFTPNGDGKNDEFRVAYKSLSDFQVYVFNRWGRKVYESSNPQKGWDGKINGKEAAAGTYFYIIKATGEDGQKYKESGDINLLR